MEDKNKQYHKFGSYHPPHHEHPHHTEKKSHHTRLQRANLWLKKHPKLTLGLVIAFIVLIAGVVLLILNRGIPSSSTTPVQATAQAQKYYSLLTGKEVSEADSKRPVTAVMIENSPDARPQSGLKEAGAVFEAVAEGGITRFLVLYQEGKPKLIGPVRSVRPHYASILAGFDAGLAHVGGSEIPLKKLRSGKIKDLDQFFNADSYWRATDRFAPHNVYTSTEKLDALNKAKKYNSSLFIAWQHNKKATPSAAPKAKTITIPVSSGLFEVNYSWDKTKNTYSRSQGGAPHTDREKGKISPSVVVAMQVPHDAIQESNGYSYPNVIGTGKAWIFQNGSAQQINWKKTNDKNQFTFTDAEGKTVKFNQGQAWFTLIKPDTKPTWK